MHDVGLEFSCGDCGWRGDRDAGRCPDCGGHLGPAYDPAAFDPGDLEIDATPTSMWAFDQLLPETADESVSLGEGGTPLVSCPTLEAELSADILLIKDEGHNPTGTVADRACSVALTAAASDGETDVALPSTGADGVAAAAYAARAGLDAHAFVPSRCSHTTKAMLNVHGGDMTVVEGRLQDATAAFAEAMETEDWAAIDPGGAPWRATGAATLLPELLAQSDDGAPDAIVVPTGHGELLAGLHAAAELAEALGILESMPRLVAVQPEGCAPIVRAIEDGTDVRRWEQPDTIAGSLEVPEPAFGRQAVAAVEETEGEAVAVPDDDLLAAACRIAAGEGVAASVAGGAAVAGTWALDDDGAFGDEETVVVVNTGAGSLDSDVLRSHLMRAG